MKLSTFLLPTLLVAALGLAACDKRAPTAPMSPTATPTTPTTPSMPGASTPDAVMPPARSGSAP